MSDTLSVESDTDNWSNHHSPVLPDTDYNHFIELSNRVGAFVHSCSIGEHPSTSEMKDFLSFWEGSQAVLEATLNTFSEGNKRFFKVNLPFKILSDFVEIAEEMSEREYPDLNLHLQDAKKHLGNHVESCSEVLKHFKKDLLTENDLAPYSALKALSIIAAYSDDIDVVEQSISSLEDVLPEILDNLKKDTPDIRYAIPALQILRYSSEMHPEIASAIIRTLTTKVGGQVMSLFSPTDIRNRKYFAQLEPDLRMCIEQKYDEWGLDTKILMDHFDIPNSNARLNSQKFNFRESVVPASLSVVSALESTEPGIARVLQEDFGLNNFYRYPPAMLLRQYQERNDTSKRYGLIWTPTIDEQDWVRNSMEAIEELYNQIEEGYSLRFFEAKQKHGPNGLARMLHTFNKKYNSGMTPRKPDFIIAVAHSFLSAPDTIHFGEQWNPKSYLTTTDLSHRRLRPIKDYFEEDPDIILASCKVDKDFRPVIENLFGGSFFASQELVNGISEIQWNQQDGSSRIRLTPTFIEHFTHPSGYYNSI